MKTAYLWEKGECETNEDSLVLQQAETRVGTVTRQSAMEWEA